MSLLKSASIGSLLTLASRIAGLVREQLFASYFGASATTDAFQVAFRIPNLLRRLFAEGAFSQAFVPILGETRVRQGEEATRGLIDSVATVLFWSLLMASGLQESGGFDMAVLMTRWMFPYIGFMSLVALSAGVLNTWGHFAVPAATPVLLNVSVITATVLGAPLFRRWGFDPVLAVAIGVMLGGVLQLGIQ